MHRVPLARQHGVVRLTRGCRQPLGDRMLKGVQVHLAGAFVLAVSIIACQVGERFETCTLCGSTRAVSWMLNERILYRSPGFAHGRHVWRSGMSAGVRISNGSVVLVRRQLPDSGRTVYGAFILTKQDNNPEQMSYRWYLRPDGLGRFDTTVSSFGTEENRHRVRFGPFDVGWSGARIGAGYLYYAKFAHEMAVPSDTYLCITTETGIEGLDAAASQWHYHFSPAQ